MKAGKEYNVYRGLQKPLVFQSFKGRFIYWGIGSLLGGLISCMILCSVVNMVVGILSLIIIAGGGLTITGIKQKKGLHSKTKLIGCYILPKTYHYYRNGKKSI